MTTPGQNAEEPSSTTTQYPIPTETMVDETEDSGDELPKNPNFPWGGESPINRHQNMTEMRDGPGGSDLSFKEGASQPRWAKAFNQLTTLWRRLVESERE